MLLLQLLTSPQPPDSPPQDLDAMIVPVLTHTPTKEEKKWEKEKKEIGKEKEEERKEEKGRLGGSEEKIKSSSSWSMANANITDSHKIYRNLGDRGLHLVVLNQHTGRVMARRVFDTFSTGVENEMVQFIDDVRDGRILVFAVL
ncbi:hypothetical protein Pcinc_032988, partial [Petrolisthes cinctipes]